MRNSGLGIGLPSLLFCIFLVLKLCGVIGWSWWWVTAPLWISACVFAGILLVFVLLALAAYAPRRG